MPKRNRMRRVKLTEKWCKYVIADEEKASKDYARHGFPTLAKQEAHHKKVLTKACKGVMMSKGVPKRDGSGIGRRANRGRGGCNPLKNRNVI